MTKQEIFDKFIEFMGRFAEIKAVAALRDGFIMTTPFTGPLWITPGSTITATATRSGQTGGDNTLTLHLLIEGIEVS